MKKLLALLLSLCLVAALCAGCGSTPTPAEDDSTTTTPEEPVTVRLGGLKGPTSMGMVKLLSDNDAGKTTNHYEFSMAGSADELTPKMLQGELDILAVPVNLGSVLYNNSDGAVQLLAVNTLGVIYLVEKGGQTVTDWNSLKGQTIYATGKGSTPEYALNYLLAQNGLDPETDVTVEYKSEHSECLAALLSNEGSVAVLPQPFVTTAQMKQDSVHVALDLTAEWAKLQEGSEEPSAMLTGIVIARTDYVAEHPEEVSKFLDGYKASVEYVNANVDDAAKLIAAFDIVPEAVAQKALPYCQIVFIEGAEMKEQLSGYLKVLFDQNPQSVGGALPDDAFYFQR